MTFFTILALALALAMDAFAVALTTGMQSQRINAVRTMRMSFAFGFFQFAMPVVGWFLGSSVFEYIESYDHWIAFGLLAFIGGKMLWEAWSSGDEATDTSSATDPTKGMALFLLAVATSVDAMAVGLSMALLGEDVWFPALVIGIVCCVLTACGMHLGRIMRNLAGNWGNRANALGGVVLIVIGANILRDHGVFS